MATALSTTGAELIGFQSQLCRVSHQPTSPSAPSPFLHPPFGPYSEQPLDAAHGRAARTPLQSPSRRHRHRKYRLYCIFHEVNSAEFGIARVQGFARDMRGSEPRYSRVIKGSPGWTDAKINKPAVMNEAESLESSQI